MTATAAQPQRTPADLVAEDPAGAVVLDRIGVDFCCHGDRSLADACSEAGLGSDEVAAALSTAAEVPVAWTEGGRRDLAACVESTHHSYLYAEPWVTRVTEVPHPALRGRGRRGTGLGSALGHEPTVRSGPARTGAVVTQ